MISVLFTPAANTEEFEKRHTSFENTLTEEHEYLCAIAKNDPMVEWFTEYCDKNKIKRIILPDLGFTVFTNILAARTCGDLIYYSSPFSNADCLDKGWDTRVRASIAGYKDGIYGCLLSDTPNNINCDSILVPQKVFCALGYYAMPLFETQVYGARWNASILTELKRLCNIPCGITYSKSPNEDGYALDRDMFDCTRRARVTACARLEQFMEDRNDS